MKKLHKEHLLYNKVLKDLFVFDVDDSVLRGVRLDWFNIGSLKEENTVALVSTGQLGGSHAFWNTDLSLVLEL